jgi:hypothetical protein
VAFEEEAGEDLGSGADFAEDGDRTDGGFGEFGGDVIGDFEDAHHADVDGFMSSDAGFEVLAGVDGDSEGHEAALDSLADRGVVGGEEVADGSDEEVGAAGVKALFNEEIDLAHIDHAEVE